MRYRFAAALVFVAAGGLIYFYSIVPFARPTKAESNQATAWMWSDVDPVSGEAYNPPSKTLSETELSSDSQVLTLRARADEILRNLKQICAEFHLEFVGPDKLNSTRGTVSSTGAYMESADFDFRFWLPSQQVVSWNNAALALALINTEGASIRGTPSVQHWNQEKAFEIGEAFLHALLNGTEIRLIRGNASFFPQQTKNGTGQWVLNWRRVDSHGYRFNNNVFIIRLPEGYCPVAARIPEIKTYIETNQTLISQAKAFEIARQVDPKSTADEWKVIKDDLGVRVDEAGTPEIVNNRLMWFFWFNPPGNGRDSRPVFVDAYTGEMQSIFLP